MRKFMKHSDSGFSWKDPSAKIVKCFRCEQPLANGPYNGVEYCGCRIPDVTGSSLIKLRDLKPTQQLFDMDDNVHSPKLAGEKPLDTNTHPTVLTWLIRKVELWDILDIFYYLDKIGERNCLLVQCDSFSAAFRALGNTRLYIVPGFDYNALRRKYFEDDGKGYFSGEIVEPIIR